MPPGRHRTVIGCVGAQRYRRYGTCPGIASGACELALELEPETGAKPKNRTQIEHDAGSSESGRLAKRADLQAFSESGRQDLNLRPPGPQPGALPDCATPRGRQAGDGNRTRPRSLEGFCATTTLRPQAVDTRIVRGREAQHPGAHGPADRARQHRAISALRTALRREGALPYRQCRWDRSV